MKPRTIQTFCVATVLFALLLCGCSSTRRDHGSAAVIPEKNQKEKVTGIGGVFFKSRDPKGLANWYREHLGIESKGGYANFDWREKDHPEQVGRTAWSLFPTNTTYFGPSSASLMINYRVANLDRLLDQLRQEGISVGKIQDFSYGKFSWITDPEGNRIELWEPK